MDQILYVWEEDQASFKPLNLLSQIGNVRQICKGQQNNQFMILSETGCLFNILFQNCFFQMTFRNERIKSITTNSSVTLAISYSGRLYSFGDDSHQYGTIISIYQGLIGVPRLFYAPNPIQIGKDFKKCSISSQLACALDYFGRLWIWGQTPMGKFDQPYRVEQSELSQLRALVSVSAGKDFIILIDSMGQIFVLTDTFKVTSEFFSSQKWILHKVEQNQQEHLVITEILPGDKYSYFLTSSQIMYIMLISSDKIFLKRISLHIRLHNATQTETYLYAFTPTGMIVKIHKGNLYNNEGQEVSQILDQLISFDNFESIQLKSIKPLLTLKNSNSSVQAFIVDKQQFLSTLENPNMVRDQKWAYDIQKDIENSSVKSHKADTQIKLGIIQHNSPNLDKTKSYNDLTPPKPFKSQDKYTPIRQTANMLSQLQKQLYFSPQQLPPKSSKSNIVSPLKQSTPMKLSQSGYNKSFIMKSPSALTSPEKRLFINSQDNLQKSPSKRKNLLQQLVYNVQTTINDPFEYKQEEQTRERAPSIRSGSVNVDSIKQMIKEFGPRPQSQEKEKINEVIYQQSQYDKELENQMENVRNKLDNMEGRHKSRMISQPNFLNTSTISQIQNNQQRINQIFEDKNPTISRKGSNRKISANLSSLLQSEDENQMKNIQIQQISQSQSKEFDVDILQMQIQDQNNQAQELAEQQQDMKADIDEELLNLYYVEEELLNQNLKTGKQQRKLIRRQIDQDEYDHIEQSESIKQVRNDGQIIIARRIVEDKDWMEEWNKLSEGIYQKLIKNNEDVMLLEEEILVKQRQSYQRILQRIPFKKNSKLGTNLNENSNNNLIVSRTQVENINSQIYLEKNGWKNNKGLLQQILNLNEPLSYVEEETVQVIDEQYQKRYLIRRPYNNSEEDLTFDTIVNEEQTDQSIIIIRKEISNEFSLKTLQEQGWEQISQNKYQRILNQKEPQFLIEEELLQQNANDQVRMRILRLPKKQEDIKTIQKGNNLNIQVNKNEFIVERIIVRNLLSHELIVQSGWSEGNDRYEIFIKKEQVNLQEEHLIQRNVKKNTQKQLLVRKPIPKQEQNYGENIDEILSDDLVIRSRIKVLNNKSLSLMKQEGWTIKGVQQKVLVESEPLQPLPQKFTDQELKIQEIQKQGQYIEEEILIQNPKTGKQQRVVRIRPIDENLDIGEQLNQTFGDGVVVVSRKVKQNINDINNDWNLNEQGQLEKVVKAQESIKLVEEEVLIPDNNGGYKRMIIRRPFQQKDQKLEQGDIHEETKDGIIRLSRNIIDNLQSENQQIEAGFTVNKNGEFQKIVSEQEPEDYYEEEIIKVNKKTGKQERIIIRRPVGQEEELGNDLQEQLNDSRIVVSRKKVKNNQTIKQLEQENWQQSNGQFVKQIVKDEPTQFIEEEILQQNPKTGQMERKIIRRPVLNNKEIGQLQLGDDLDDEQQDGAIVVSRKVVANNQSIEQTKQQGWNSNLQKQQEKIINQKEPQEYIEEEILVVNKKTGQQERKIVRRPVQSDDEELSDNDNLQQQDQNGNIIVSRKRVQNRQSTINLQQDGWTINKQGQLEKTINKNEPTQFIEEEILRLNKQTGQMERKVIRKPVKNQQDLQQEQGSQLEEENSDGDIVVSRKLVNNQQSIKQQDQSGWQINKNQQQEKIISQKEPQEFIEEEVLILNKKTGKQERQVIRRPITSKDKEQEFGEDIEEQQKDGVIVVARRKIKNNSSIQNIQQQGWQQDQKGQMIKVINKDEPIQYIEEEVLQLNQQTGQMERKIIRKPLLNQNQSLEQGDDLQEENQNGQIVVSRKIVNNQQSVQKQKQQGWSDSKKQQEIVISQKEPEEYIEEETGKQERKLIRRPVKSDDEDMQYGDDIEDQQQDGVIVVARRKAKNNTSIKNLEQQGWQQNKNGELEKVIIQNEPTQFIEEEILQFNKQTGQMERKIVRRPVIDQNDLQLQQGDDLEEENRDGAIIVSRKLVNNKQSVQQQQKGWSNKQGIQEKVISKQEPGQFIEEEMLVVNKETGKQERKLIRRPVNSDSDQEYGDDIQDEKDGHVVVSRRKVRNTTSKANLESQGWKTDKNGELVKIVNKEEPAQFIEEEILKFNKKTGKMERKIIRRPFEQDDLNLSQGSDLDEIQNDGGKVVARRIVDNTQSLVKQNQQNFKEEVISLDEPQEYIEEEVIIVNKQTGKQERKLIRRPKLDDNEQYSENLAEEIQDGVIVVARRKVKNDQSIKKQQSQGWKQNKEGFFEKQISQNEPAVFIEEEVLTQNPKTGELERKIIRRPITKKDEMNLDQGDDLEEVNKNGDTVVSRKYVKNDISQNLAKQQGWNTNGQSQSLVISKNEPEDYFIEEVLIINPKTGKQERKLIRRPAIEDEEQGDIQEEKEDGVVVVSRQKVKNAQSQKLLEKEGWILNNGQYEKVLEKNEPTQFIEEEVLQKNAQTGALERKIIRRPVQNNKDLQLKQGDDLEENQDGQIILSRKIVDNKKSKEQQAKEGFSPGKKEIILQEEPDEYVEEEIIVINKKTGKQERKLIRRPIQSDDDDKSFNDELQEQGTNGETIVSRKRVRNNTSMKQLQQQGWQQGKNGQLQKVINQSEPSQIIEEEVLVLNEQTGAYDRKLIRRPVDSEENSDQNMIVVSKKVVPNIQSQQGWSNVEGQLIKTLKTNEPLEFIEEEIIIPNKKSGKQIRKLIRRPANDQNLQLGENLEEIQQDGSITVARRLIKNITSLNDGWQLNEENEFEKIINPKESMQIVVEEQIILNKNGTQERRLVRRPLINQKEQLGDDLKEINDQGNLIVSRKVIQNVQSSQQNDWTTDGQIYYKVLQKDEPQKYVEEEILVPDNNKGVLLRKLIRRPFKQQDKNLNYGQDIQEVLQNGQIVVSRKIVENNKSIQSNDMKEWLKNKQQYEKQISEEPIQYIEEEVLLFDKKSGQYLRKIIRRSFVDDDLEFGDDLNEADGQNFIVARRFVENNFSQQQIQDQGWMKQENQLEKIISNEPIEFIEEEILTINQKTGKQERKIVRRPITKNDQNLDIGNNLSEQTQNGFIVSRQKIQNNSSNQAIQQQGFVKTQLGYEKVINQAEPTQFIEEEILQQNPKTGQMERKIVRRPVLNNKEIGQLQLGEDLDDEQQDGVIVVSRKVVANNQSIEQTKQQGWSSNFQKQQEKIINQKEPQEYIEEEILVVNKKTGQQERKIVRRPVQSDDEELSDNDNLQQQDQNGNIIVSRKRVQNRSSTINLQQDGWTTNKQGQLEKIINKNEPTQFIEEEVLRLNKQTGQMERKIIRKPVKNQQDLQQEQGSQLEEENSDGDIVVSRKLVNNQQSIKQQDQSGWQINKNQQQEKIISQKEPQEFIEEEVLILNKKTGKQERQVIRRPITSKDKEQEFGEDIEQQQKDGVIVVARRKVKNNSSILNIQQQGWQQDQKGQMIKVINRDEPIQYIEEEVLQLNQQTGQMERKIIRKPLLNQNQQLEQGDDLQEENENGQIVVSRKVVNNQQSVQKQKQQGWSDSKKQQEIVISQKEPEEYIEEEVIIINKKTGKQERKLIRRPVKSDDEDIQYGDDIEDQQQDGVIVVARRKAKNNTSIKNLEQQGWQQNKNGELEKVIQQNEPTQFIEEEILQLNQQTGQMERKVVRRPVIDSKDGNKQQGENLQEKLNDGTIILSRKIIENKQSQQQQQVQGWVQKQNVQEKVISQSEPQEYIEEEVLIINPKTGKQERRLIRRQVTKNDDNQEFGDDINDQRDGMIVVSRKKVPNNQSQSEQQKWINDKGQQYKILNKDEPIQYIEEEILQLNKDTGNMERKIIRRPFSNKDKLLEQGDELEEESDKGYTVVSRKLVNNQISNQKKNELGINLDGLKQQVIVINQQEPEEYIEEEVLIINKKTGQQERKLIRRPVKDDEEIELGEDIQDTQENGVIVVARRKAKNNTSLKNLESQGWQQNKDGQLEKIIQQNEPTQFIEEEVLQLNPQTGQMQRKIVRRPVLNQKDLQKEQGVDLNDVNENGDIIVSRKIVSNTTSIQKQQKEGWQQNKQVQEKIINKQEPQQYIEEEVLVINPKTGKQERKLIRRPADQMNQNQEFGDNIKDQADGQVIVARRMVRNNSSIQQGWTVDKNGQMIKQINKDEPTSFIEEEILIENENGTIERKLIRRPISKKDRELEFGDDLEEIADQGTVVSRRIISNQVSSSSIQQQQDKISVEPAEIIEEEIIIINDQNKQQRVLQRRFKEKQDEKLKISFALLENIAQNKIIVSREITKNNKSMKQLQDWTQIGNNVWQQVICQSESINLVEEEQLQANRQTGLMTRLKIRLQLPQKDYQKLQYGTDLQQLNKNGDFIAARSLIPNNESSYQIRNQGWNYPYSQSQSQKISQNEPTEFVQEDLIIYDKSNYSQSRILKRRPYTIDDEDLVYEEPIKEQIAVNQILVHRQRILNQFSLKFIKDGGWINVGNNIYELILIQQEPYQYLQEEILENNGEFIRRKFVARQFVKTDEKLQFGISLSEQLQKQLIVSRQILLNDQPSTVALFEGWQQVGDQVYVQIINEKEPPKYYEEELLIQNKKVGTQRRILQRVDSNASNLEVAIQLNEQLKGNKLIVSREVVDNKYSLDQIEQEGWVQQDNGYVYVLVDSEPLQLIEEEIIKFIQSEQSYKRIVLRRKFEQSKDMGLPQGENLKEELKNGDTLISRKIIDNNFSSKTIKNEMWLQNEDGQAYKIYDYQIVVDIKQYIEEECLVKNPKTKDNEIVVMKYPWDTQRKQLQLGKRLKEQNNLGYQIMSRKLIGQNDPEYNPFQFVEEMLQINNSNQNEFITIQKQVNITEVEIGEELNEIQPNGMVIKSRRVITPFENYQFTKKENYINYQKPNNYLQQQRRSMQQIDEDSNEFRDSQYKSTEEQNHDYRMSLIRDEFGSGEKKAKSLSRHYETQLLEEEILIRNKQTQKFDRKLLRRSCSVKNLQISDDLFEKVNEDIVLSRLQAPLMPQEELSKQGFIEINGLFVKVLSKNENDELIEEETIKEEGQNIIQQLIRKQPNPKVKPVLGNNLDEKLPENTKLVKREMVRNCSLQSFKTNGFTKQKDGSYLKQVVSQSVEKEHLSIKIPKYHEKQKSSLYQFDNLKDIQDIQRSPFQKSSSLASFNNQNQEYEQFFQENCLSFGRIGGSQPQNLEIANFNQQNFDDGAIINRTNYSDISETDKMLLKSLDRKEYKKSKSTSSQQFPEDRLRIGSDRNNKSGSSKFSDSFQHGEQMEVQKQRQQTAAVKMIRNFMNKMMVDKFRSMLTQFTKINNIKEGQKIIQGILMRNYRSAFCQLKENLLYNSRTKNINTIEFNEDDVIKYNQMLTENKVIHMDQSELAELEEQSEPVELAETPPKDSITEFDEKQMKQMMMHKMIQLQKKQSPKTSIAVSPQAESSLNSSQSNKKQDQSNKSVTSIKQAQPSYIQQQLVKTPQHRQNLAKSQTVKLTSQTSPKKDQVKQSVFSNQKHPTVVGFNQSSANKPPSNQSSSKKVDTQGSSKKIDTNGQHSQKTFVTPTISSLSYNTQSQNISQISLPKSNQVVQAQQQKEKIAEKFKKMGSSSLGSFRVKK
ncbi:hypothetical protein pb186bvf_020739 [Paramecium bursaria]